MDNCWKILESIDEPVIAISKDESIIYENQASKQLGVILGKDSYRKLLDYVLDNKYLDDRISVKGIFVEINRYRFLVDAFSFEEGIVLLIRDITRFVELEEITKKEGLIFTITKLLSSIFHDMKGPISGIKGAVQLLKEDPEDRELIEDILYEINRLENLISEITFITKPLNLHKTETNIHEIIERVVKSLENVFSGVVFIKRYDPSIPDILVDKEYMTRVLTNIIRNGIEAINEKGSIEISTGISWDKIYSPKGNSIFIRIKDSGKGVPEEILDKLFLPFTSTKKTGMGIGLSSAYKIVKEHQGIIRYIGDSTFEILLPIKGVK